MGHVATNAHVVNDCEEVRVRNRLIASPVEIVAIDGNNDLAVLQSDAVRAPTAVFAGKRPPRIGEKVVVAGFPLSGILSEDIVVTFGEVSALAGIRSDRRYLQISAPVQPGNSGGALLNSNGRVIGVVTSKLDAVDVMNLTGDIPQNVNFAVKGTLLLSLLEINGIPYEANQDIRRLENPEIAELAQGFTVQVECY